MPKQLHILINGRRCITIHEASEAYHYSPVYLRAFVCKHRIPYHLVGNVALVDADALQDRIEAHIRRPKLQRPRIANCYAKTSATETKNQV